MEVNVIGWVIIQTKTAVTKKESLDMLEWKKVTFTSSAIPP